ncbi:MAG: hypothetical protein RML36_00125 [Anaerolineae bacterium]|nr:hypothetical protein [Anaerolineae bacterium]MDW8097874.1 hypothetical protein [Anaerolineae bacterium]
MGTREVVLDWQIGEEEDWGASTSLLPFFADEQEPEPKPTIPPHRLRWNYVLGGLVALALLTMAAVGYGFWQRYQQALLRIRADIQGTVDLEAWAWRNGDDSLLASLIDTQRDEAWAYRFRRMQEWMRRWAGDRLQMPIVEAQDVKLYDDLAMVVVLVTQPAFPWETAPYRETRFYRLVNGRWLRTAPAPALWGPLQTTETEHFRFEFHQRDAKAVIAAAPKVEALYGDLHRLVGLEETSSERLVIKVVPRTDVISWRFLTNQLTVPSPVLLAVPQDMSEAEALIQAIAYPLTRRVVDQAAQQAQVKTQWQPLVLGLRLWLSWDNSRLPSFWRFRLEESLRQRMAQAPAPRLADLIDSGQTWLYSNRWASTMAAVTVVDHMMTRYGRDRLSALLRGLGRYESWDELIPAVFGVPADAWEASWQAYLKAQYGPPTTVRSGEQRSYE